MRLPWGTAVYEEASIRRFFTSCPTFANLRCCSCQATGGGNPDLRLEVSFLGVGVSVEGLVRLICCWVLGVLLSGVPPFEKRLDVWEVALERSFRGASHGCRPFVDGRWGDLGSSLGVLEPEAMLTGEGLRCGEGRFGNTLTRTGTLRRSMSPRCSFSGIFFLDLTSSFSFFFANRSTFS